MSLVFLSVGAKGDQKKTVLAIRVNGVINPVSAEFISKSISRASAMQAEALVIELDTPGGLDTSMRNIVKEIIGSSIPVVVYVSPSGARAASAGVFITLAAHVAAMAPGTNIGAAHPVSMGGKMDTTMAEKATNDAAAYIKSLAERTGRNAAWAEDAVRKERLCNGNRGPEGACHRLRQQRPRYPAERYRRQKGDHHRRREDPEDRRRRSNSLRDGPAL